MIRAGCYVCLVHVPTAFGLKRFVELAIESSAELDRVTAGSSTQIKIRILEEMNIER